ncbi:MAG TPA: metallophosphoesterase, partial [Crenalkalicoccus sp.]|nr:metallophosphoesterase [Crenalkalicoccus sp.]
ADGAVRLAAAVAEIRTRHGPGGALPAAFAVITGDLTRDGEPEAYARLAALLAPLPFPVHLMMGNHDDRAAFAAAFPAAPRDAGGFVQQAFDTPAGRCVLLDTLSPGETLGRLCPERLDWLRGELARSAGPVLLFLHHPPVLVGIPGMDAIPLVEPEALWAVLAPHRARLRHIFFGHLHRTLAGSWQGVPLSCNRGTAFEVPLEFGTDIVVPARAAPSYAVVRIAGEALIAHARDVPGAD